MRWPVEYLGELAKGSMSRDWSSLGICSLIEMIEEIAVQFGTTFGIQRPATIRHIATDCVVLGAVGIGLQVGVLEGFREAVYCVAMLRMHVRWCIGGIDLAGKRILSELRTMHVCVGILCEQT